MISSVGEIICGRTTTTTATSTTAGQVIITRTSCTQAEQTDCGAATCIITNENTALCLPEEFTGCNLDGNSSIGEGSSGVAPECGEGTCVVEAGVDVYGARLSTEIYARGCHWFPRLLGLKRACV
jgi:hypothetical protein